MGKRVFGLIVLCLLLFECSGRKADIPIEEDVTESEVWNGDIGHIRIIVNLFDSSGNNYLESESFSHEAFYAEFRNTSYYLNQDLGEYKEDPSMGYGEFLGLHSQLFAGHPSLCFGWLHGEEEINYADVVFHWPNGKTDTVTIYNHYDSASNKKVDRTFYLNGKVSGPNISIVI